MPLTQKIAIAAGALTLAAGGVAAAAGSPSVEADKGLTTAETEVDSDLPASKDAHPGEATETETEVEAEAPDTEASDTESTEVEDEVEDEGTGPVDNHGAVVSAEAQSDEHTGREHGEAVSAVARANAGADHAAQLQAPEAASSHGRP